MEYLGRKKRLSEWFVGENIFLNHGFVLLDVNCIIVRPQNAAWSCFKMLLVIVCCHFQGVKS
jgi:hypothetical protein